MACSPGFGWEAFAPVAMVCGRLSSTDTPSATAAQSPLVGDALHSGLQTPFLHSAGRAYPRESDAGKGHSSHSHSAPARFSWLKAFFTWILSVFSFIHFLLLFAWAVQVLAQLD